ncbi:hypothetical protein KFY57_27245, partial [Salmonella enterica subsp. enterica serovar Typhimurium]|nr:hypothetical protein [Salmonella enterica subsp. enterica serovar Typhimurium]
MSLATFRGWPSSNFYLDKEKGSMPKKRKAVRGRGSLTTSMSMNGKSNCFSTAVVKVCKFLYNRVAEP